MQVAALHPYMAARTAALAQVNHYEKSWCTDCGPFVHGRPLILTWFPGYDVADGHAEGDGLHVNCMEDLAFDAEFWARLRDLIPERHHGANLAFACPFKAFGKMEKTPAKQASRALGLELVDMMISTLQPSCIVVVGSQAFDDMIERWCGGSPAAPNVGHMQAHQTGTTPRTVVYRRSCTFEGQLGDVMVYRCTSVAKQAALAKNHITGMNAYLDRVMP